MIEDADHWRRAFKAALDERDQLRTRLTETEALAERWNAEANEFAERLAEVEAERDRRTSASYWPGLTAENAGLRARLAEVEADRAILLHELLDARARLAAVLALCDRADGQREEQWTLHPVIPAFMVRAAAAGDDRATPAETVERCGPACSEMHRYTASCVLRPAGAAAGDDRATPAETHVFEVGEMFCRLCKRPIGDPAHVEV